MQRWMMALLLAACVAGCNEQAEQYTPSKHTRPVTAAPVRPHPYAAEWAKLCQTPATLSADAVFNPNGLSQDGSFRQILAWQIFLAHDGDIGVPFLLTRLASTDPTAMAAANSLTTEGELAVYVIQQFLKFNWTDYDGAHAAEITQTRQAHAGNPRAALHAVLADPVLRTELARYVRKVLHYSQPERNPGPCCG